ncbi:hypothetical protein HK100_007017 [Physocladia obscura]|uniref:Uncharacterized protein n=1 Tax=Physocladia obscura TaxID=109957 RepID=A0AAD5XCC0_9FUNG|nr:hypothetical protein HK100_007017 [Physocladia obscura]
MASVIRAKWGTHVPFINTLSRKRNLYSLLAVLAANAGGEVGVRVVPTKWVNSGIENSYYTVTKARFTHGFRDGRIEAVRTWKGQTDDAARAIDSEAMRFSWRTYADPGEHAALKKKLGV